MARTPQTITDPTQLKKVLEDIRLRGCAVEDEESEVGMRCIAAPLRDDTGESAQLYVRHGDRRICVVAAERATGLRARALSGTTM